MLLEEIIKPDTVLCNAHARSKKHCLEILSELLAQSNPDLSQEDIFAGLVDRERLGCTGLGQNVAFPHCRLAGLKDSVGAFIKLSAPVDFDTTDGQPVDLVFGLVVPEQLDTHHYSEIETITTSLSQPDLLQQLRNATSSRTLYEALLSTPLESDNDIAVNER